MRRVTRAELRTKLVVAITVRKQHTRRGLALITDGAIDDLVDDLLNRIMGRPESEAVILEPDLAGPAHAPWRGRWGEDEPHPMDKLAKPTALRSSHRRACFISMQMVAAAG